MTLEKLDKIIEGILFVSGNPVAEKDLTEKLDISLEDLDSAVNAIERKYSCDSGVMLLKFNNKLQLATNPAYVDAITSVLNPIKEKELSRACLETLAIIAYRQPATRLEVEEVRGVSSDYTIQILEKNRLIEVVGRKDAIGKPLLFGTTEEFLKRFGLQSIDALPDYDALLERLQTIENPKTEDDSLYNRFEVPVEESRPDFLEGEDVIAVGEIPTIRESEDETAAADGIDAEVKSE